MRLIFIIVLSIFFIHHPIRAQDGQNSNNLDILSILQAKQPGSGDVKIIQDGAIANLLAKHTEANRSRRGVPGYRIRIFSDSGHNAKNRAYGVKSEFYSKYPDIQAYLVFKTPNYKVYVGDFRTKLEAFQVAKMIQNNFPNAFIVNDRINTSE